MNTLDTVTFYGFIQNKKKSTVQTTNRKYVQDIIVL